MMSKKEAMMLFEENFKKALAMPNVYDPVGWALYKTWRKAENDYKHGIQKRKEELTTFDGNTQSNGGLIWEDLKGE